MLKCLPVVTIIVLLVRAARETAVHVSAVPSLSVGVTVVLYPSVVKRPHVAAPIVARQNVPRAAPVVARQNAPRAALVAARQNAPRVAVIVVDHNAPHAAAIVAR